jgi:hypothetical protein
MDEVTLTVNHYQLNLIGLALKRMRDHCDEIINGVATQLAPPKPPEAPKAEEP